LSSIGLFGLLAYTVARRTAEIGVRMAPGARPGDVARFILREAWVMTAWGLGAGLPLAIGLGFAARGAFHGVDPYDPLTMAAAALALLLAATFAAWLPARRAARVDPLQALRSD
jgi:ABC-type antimicrobial peptide transport system permease subunit